MEINYNKTKVLKQISSFYENVFEYKEACNPMSDVM